MAVSYRCPSLTCGCWFKLDLNWIALSCFVDVETQFDGGCQPSQPYSQSTFQCCRNRPCWNIQNLSFPDIRCCFTSSYCLRGSNTVPAWGVYKMITWVWRPYNPKLHLHRCFHFDLDLVSRMCEQLQTVLDRHLSDLLNARLGCRVCICSSSLTSCFSSNTHTDLTAESPG